MENSKICLLAFLFPFFCFAQTFSGKVIDKITQQPIETASVYFDNTTIGTTTNENGEFSITYSDAVQSTLVISYLGYEKVLISNYRFQNNVTIELVEANNALDEVYIEYDDGLTRRQKLRLFRREFLGTSKFGKSCKILNEDDLILRYDKGNKSLYASAKSPVRVENKALQYEIAFDIIDFEVEFRYVEIKTSTFTVNTVAFHGTSFYKDLKNSEKKKTFKNRETAYEFSVQRFMRSLYNKNLRDEGYWIYYGKLRVEEWSYFTIEDIADSDLKKVKLKDKVTILYNKELQSELQIKVDEFFVDVYGNYTPITGVYFSGIMGSQRVGDSLPLDYGLDN
ncbi:carboxypeptidase-like regulatory domain-containing protein [Winogradskyella sp. R77965]|uniref:carboxypeptidase-like regulatory domain-containing protein n=1 Tax=Winogradskyella sp. R77965 TaxID=3093872 RepID=UPI0037DDBFE9